MIPFKNDIWDAFDMLQNLDKTLKKDIPDRIINAQEIVANTYGISILPAMKWTVESKAYSQTANINYILMFTASVASDIRNCENSRECELWLKENNKEWIVERDKERILTTFDYAYEKWHKRQVMSNSDILKSQCRTIDRYNRTFTERQGKLYFTDDLEKVCV
jgi:hypothetical protein